MADESSKQDSKPASSRRTFLAMSIGGAVLAGGAAGVSYLVRERGEEQAIEPPEPMSATGEVMAERLRKKLPMLDLPDATVSKWVNRYEQHRKPFDAKKGKISRKTAQNFLLSTDFFPDCDEGRPLRFVAYYDPYISVCYNPLRPS